MQQRPTYLILFPGAWGNGSVELVLWWFQTVISYIVGRFGDNVVIKAMVYDNSEKYRNLDDFASDCLALLNRLAIPSDARVIAVGYSMGGQVMRLVASLWEGRFDYQIVIASSGPNGLRTAGFLRAWWAIFKAFNLGALTGWVELCSVNEIYRLFFAPKPKTDAIVRRCLEIVENSRPESFWACLQLYYRRLPPLRGKVYMILPEDDVLFKDELDDRGTRGEDWEIFVIPGGHGDILSYENMARALHWVDWSE